jgi:hypothetical protein
MTPAKRETGGNTHTFAWDGVSFDVPDTWQLANYSFRHNVTRVELEDDYALRLEAEWARPRYRVDPGKIQKRFTKASRKLVEAASKTERLPETRPCRAPLLYSMPDRSQLLICFVLVSEPKFACFFRIYFNPDDPEKPRSFLKRIARSFQLHHGDTTPWAFYDMSFKLPAEFRLAQTTLEAGRKLLVFHWRLRRFFLWQCSLANLVLKDQTPEQWAADFLNKRKDIRGPKFEPGHYGTIETRRGWPYILGHYEEIGRLCFRYRARVIHDEENNRLILWVFHYRQPEDVHRLPKELTE